MKTAPTVDATFTAIGAAVPMLSEDEFLASAAKMAKQGIEGIALVDAIRADVLVRRDRHANGAQYGSDVFWEGVRQSARNAARAELLQNSQARKDAEDLRARADAAKAVADEAEQELDKRWRELKAIEPQIEKAAAFRDGLQAELANLGKANLEKVIAELYEMALTAPRGQDQKLYLECETYAAMLCTRDIRVGVINKLLAGVTANLKQLEARKTDLLKLF